MPLYVCNAAKAIQHSFSQNLGPQCKESHTLLPAYMQITASTMDHCSLCDLHRTMTVFLEKEKYFSLCQYE